MPCDRIQQTTIDLGKVDQAMLMAALTTLGHQPRLSGNTIYCNLGTINTTTGILRESQGLDALETVSTIKKAISGEIIKATAKRFGWQVKTLPNNQYEVIKNTI